MAFAIIEDDYTVSTAVRLQSLGIQVDPFNDVYGGQIALFDYSTMGAGIASGGAIPNMIDGSAAGSLSGFSVTDIQTKKGIRKSSASTVYAILGDAFNLLNYGSEPDVFVALWMTHEDLSAPSLGIAGYASNTSGERQWGVTTTSIANQLRLGVYNAQALKVVDLNTPYLHVFHIRKTASSVCQVDFYIDDEKIGSAASSYPLRTPANGAWPGFGAQASYANTYKGTLHRAISAQVAPGFDIEGWLDTEMAGNPKSRFTPSA